MNMSPTTSPPIIRVSCVIQAPFLKSSITIAKTFLLGTQFTTYITNCIVLLYNLKDRFKSTDNIYFVRNAKVLEN